MTTDQRFQIIPLLVTSAICTAEIAISFNSVLLPNIQSSFEISESLAQTSVSIGLFSLGFFGIIYGAVSDMLGRKPMFLTAIGLFTIASVLCATAQSIGLFLLARLLQGAGSGASWIVGNATLKDIYNGESYVAIMNKIHAIAGIVPAVAPFLGSIIAEHFSWRHGFYGLSFFGLTCWLGILFFQKETLKNKKPFSTAYVLYEYTQLWKNKNYLHFLVIKVACVSILFVDISQTPLILINHLNIPQANYGYYIAPSFLSYMISSMFAAKYSRHGLNFLKYGLILILLCAVALIIIPLTAFSSSLIKCLLYIGFGLIFGNATALIVMSAENTPGSASAIMIGLEMLLSAAGIAVVALFFKGNYVPMSIFTITMASMGMMSLMSYQKTLQRSGMGSKPPLDQG